MDGKRPNASCRPWRGGEPALDVISRAMVPNWRDRLGQASARIFSARRVFGRSRMQATMKTASTAEAM